MEVEDGLTLGGLLDKLGIPDSEPKILFVNGIHAQRSQTLKDGDRVSVFPPVAGG
jgi:sulfur carrier protein ThiS